MNRSSTATMLLAGLAVCACSSGSGENFLAIGNKSPAGSTEPQAFLTPIADLESRIASYAALRESCYGSDGRNRCGEFLFFDVPGGAGPVAAGDFATDQPHLRIIFLLTEITNTLVAGDGIGSDEVNIGGLHFTFFIDSPAVDAESPVEFTGLGYTLPPGTTSTTSWTIWRAIVLDGCDNPPAVIPVEFRHEVAAQIVPVVFQDVGVFEAEDDTSLVPTGFWNFQYTVHASANDGEHASDFDVRGTVSVVCTAETTP